MSSGVRRIVKTLTSSDGRGNGKFGSAVPIHETINLNGGFSIAAGDFSGLMGRPKQQERGWADGNPPPPLGPSFGGASRREVSCFERAVMNSAVLSG